MFARLLPLLVLALLLAPGPSTAMLVQCDDCGADCPCDASDGQCLPGCQVCLCCPLARPIVPASTTGPASLAHLGQVLWSASAPARPADPREVFHVPKSLLA